MIIYKNISEYEKIKNKYKNKFVIDIDFDNFKNISEFNKFLSTKIRAPTHYFGGLNRLFDLLLDYPEFKNSKNIVFLIKNYNKLKFIDRYYHESLLDIFNEAIMYHQKFKNGELSLYIFQ